MCQKLLVRCGGCPSLRDHRVEFGERGAEVGRDLPGGHCEKFADKPVELGRQENQIAASFRRAVGMGDACGNENRGAGGRVGLAAGEAECQRPFEDVKGFIVAEMDMQVAGAGHGPLVDGQGFARGGDGPGRRAADNGMIQRLPPSLRNGKTDETPASGFYASCATCANPARVWRTWS
jgi:hypothetical protein